MGVRSCGAAVVLIVASVSPAMAAPFAFITNGIDGVTLRLDVATNETVAIPVGIGPDSIAVTPDGGRAYVSNTGSNSVSVIDGASASVLHTVGVSGLPRGVAVAPDGTRAWVGSDDGVISVIDGIAGSVAGTIPVPGAVFHGAAADPNGARAYFAAAQGAATLVVVDTLTDTVVTSTVISNESAPSGVAVDPTGKRIYVALEDSHQVAVIDATTHLLTNVIALPCDPACPAPKGVAVSPGGETLWVAAFAGGGVAVVDVATLAQVDFVATIPFGPFGLDVTPDGRLLYVANGGNGTVSVVDTDTRTVIGTLAGFGGATAFGPFIGGPTAPPPVLDAAARKCQAAVTRGFPRLAGKTHKLVAACLDDVQRDRAGGAITTPTATGCARDLDLGDPTARVSRLVASANARLQSKCQSVTPAALGFPCDPGAADLAALADCVAARQLESAGRAIAGEYAGACALLAEVGLEEIVPGVCGP